MHSIAYHQPLGCISFSLQKHCRYRLGCNTSSTTISANPKALKFASRTPGLVPLSRCGSVTYRLPPGGGSAKRWERARNGKIIGILVAQAPSVRHSPATFLPEEGFNKVWGRLYRKGGFYPRILREDEARREAEATVRSYKKAKHNGFYSINSCTI